MKCLHTHKDHLNYLWKKIANIFDKISFFFFYKISLFCEKREKVNHSLCVLKTYYRGFKDILLCCKDKVHSLTSTLPFNALEFTSVLHSTETYREKSTDSRNLQKPSE